MLIKHLSPEVLNNRRVLAVRLRLEGHTVAHACQRSGLSAPTVSAAWKAFLEGGWQAVPVKPRGRRQGSGEVMNAAARQWLRELLNTWPPCGRPAWNSRALAEALSETDPAVKISPRAIEHWWADQGLRIERVELEGLARRRSNEGRWYRQQVKPGFDAAVKGGGVCWQGGVRVVPATTDAPPCYQLYLHGKRGALHMRCFSVPPLASDYIDLFSRLLDEANGKPVALVFHGAYFQASAEVGDWLAAQPLMRLMPFPYSAARAA